MDYSPLVNKRAAHNKHIQQLHIAAETLHPARNPNNEEGKKKKIPQHKSKFAQAKNHNAFAQFV